MRESYFRCRLPGDTVHRTAYGVEKIPAGSLLPGVVMAPFDTSGGVALRFGTNKQPEEGTPSLFEIPEYGTSKEEHIARVAEEVRVLQEMQLGREEKEIKEFKEVKEIGEFRDRKVFAKTVLARVKMAETERNGKDIYAELCSAYPDAFVFHACSPLSGEWLGASPELLCRTRGNVLSTMALAGTRLAGQTGEWDIKNREEQAIVARFIAATLGEYCQDVTVSDTYTRRAGPVEHLCCDISARLPETSSPEERLMLVSAIVSVLSPTPALCGFPREHAFTEIRRLEGFERGFYGGYLAVVDESGDTDIYVNLRSMTLMAGKAVMYAGGGIMPYSIPEDEWEELEKKTSTLERFLEGIRNLEF